MKRINEKLVKNILNIVDHGLTYGLGDPEPGKMCVEAAICYALGEPHSDQPSCVFYEIADDKILLNDSIRWGTSRTRAKGLRRVAIAQLGTKGNKHIEKNYKKLVVKYIIKDILPRFLKPKDIKLFTSHQWRRSSNGLQYGLYFRLSNYAHSYGVMSEIMSTLFRLSKGKRSKLNILKDLTKCIEKALVELKSPGSKYLYLCN